MSYRFLPHTADLLVEITGASLGQVFQDATAVIRELMVGGCPVEPSRSFSLALEAPSPEDLLIRFVRELLIQFQLEMFVPAQLQIDQLTPRHIAAVVMGEQFDDDRHESQPEVKAATRHNLCVEETGTGWRALMVLDL